MQDLRYELAKYLHVDDFLQLLMTTNEFYFDLNLDLLAHIYNLRETPKSLKHLRYIWMFEYYDTPIYNRTFLGDKYGNVDFVRFHEELQRIRRSIKRGFFSDKHLQDFTANYISQSPNDFDDVFNRGIYEIRLRLAVRDNSREDYNFFFTRENPIKISVYAKYPIVRGSFICQCVKYGIQVDFSKSGIKQAYDYYFTKDSPRYCIKYNLPLSQNITQSDLRSCLPLALEKNRIEHTKELIGRLNYLQLEFPRIRSCEGLTVYLKHCIETRCKVWKESEIFIRLRRKDLFETLLQYIGSNYELETKHLSKMTEWCLGYDCSPCYLILKEYYPTVNKFIKGKELGYDMSLLFDNAKS